MRRGLRQIGICGFIAQFQISQLPPGIFSRACDGFEPSLFPKDQAARLTAAMSRPVAASV
jgi:hypothetical protein